MTMDEIKHTLNALHTCGDPTFERAAEYIQQLIQRIQSSQLSQQDAAELLLDVQRQLQIVQDSQELHHKESLNTAITSLLSILTLGSNT